MSEQVHLERFIAAVASGKDARRRLTPGGLGQLTLHELWPQAMRQVVKLGAAHPEARRWFLNSWTRVPASTTFRRFVGDDDLLIAALRVLLPPYAADGVMARSAGERVGRHVVGAAASHRGKVRALRDRERRPA
jgi:hypothetical protein